MIQIDFLPEEYRRRRRLRHARLWWGVVAGVFGLAVTAATVVQGGVYWAVTRQYEALEADYRSAHNLDQELAALDAQIASARESANLYSLLRTPWPKTQLLAALSAPLSPSLHWSEIHLREVPLAASPTTAPSEPENPAALPPAVADHKLLENSERSRETVIEIIGIAKQLEPLHAYVDALERTPLLRRAELRSLETQPNDRGSSEFRFTLVVYVRPGFAEDPQLVSEAGASAPVDAPAPAELNEPASDANHVQPAAVEPDLVTARELTPTQPGVSP